VVEKLTKLQTDPVLWYVQIDGERIELDTVQLYSFRSVQMRAAEVLTKHLPSMKNADWMVMLSELMDTCEVVNMPPESGTAGAFTNHLHEFLLNGTASYDKSDLLNGVPYYDKDGKQYLFRLGDLVEYLKNRRFTAYSQGKVSAKLREMGAGNDEGKIKGAFVRWWTIRLSDDAGQSESFDVPEIKGLDHYEEADTRPSGDRKDYDLT